MQIIYRVLSVYFDGAGVTVALETSASSEDEENESRSAWICVLLPLVMQLSKALFEFLLDVEYMTK
jgi:hypothetical protein